VKDCGDGHEAGLSCTGAARLERGEWQWGEEDLSCTGAARLERGEWQWGEECLLLQRQSPLQRQRLPQPWPQQLGPWPQQQQHGQQVRRLRMEALLRLEVLGGTVRGKVGEQGMDWEKWVKESRPL